MKPIDTDEQRHIRIKLKLWKLLLMKQQRNVMMFTMNLLDAMEAADRTADRIEELEAKELLT